MPQIHTCPICRKVLQINEIHKCAKQGSEFAICDKCGQKYKAWQEHICPTMIK